MSVRQHLLVTLFVCLAITLGATFALHLAQRHEARDLAAEFSRERQEQLDDVVQAGSASLELFALDYSGWDEMVDFVASLHPAWAELNISAVMDRFNLSAVWLLALDGRVIHSDVAEGSPPMIPPSQLASLVADGAWKRNNGGGGFYREGDEIVELCVRPVQPTADTQRVSPPFAWLVAARRIDSTVIAQFSRRLKAEVSLHPAGDAAAGETPEGSIVVAHPLPGLDSASPVAELRAAFRIEALMLGEHYNQREMLVLLGAGALLLGVGAWSINRHVLRPLSHIGESLAHDTTEPLARVSPDLLEFTRIADLVRQSFRQREALRHEIEERVRMGRDLHDGVIQNLYATGMGLAQARRFVATNPEQASVVLEETRLTLNLTMETLRRFIAKAEPEIAGNIDFSDSCVSLFQTLRARRSCELDLDIEPQLAARLRADHLADLLFIVRESVANALRHGEARRIAVTLRPDETRTRASLRIRDNGKGCDFDALPAADEKGGRGLANIRARARALGGEAAFAHAPEGGVVVTVEWPSAATSA